VVAIVSLLLCYLAVERIGTRMEHHGRRMGAIPRKSAGMYKVSPAPSPTWDFVGSPEPPGRQIHLLGEFLTGQPQPTLGRLGDAESTAKPDVDAAAESWLGTMKLDPQGSADFSLVAASYHEASPDPTATEVGDGHAASGLTGRSHTDVGPGVADVVVSVPRLTMSKASTASTASTLGSVVDWGDVMKAQIEQRNQTVSAAELAFPRPEDD